MTVLLLIKEMKDAIMCVKLKWQLLMSIKCKVNKMRKINNNKSYYALRCNFVIIHFFNIIINHVITHLLINHVIIRLLIIY